MWSLIEHSASLAEAVIITGFTTMVLGYKSPGHKYLKYIVYTLVSFINIAFLANYLSSEVLKKAFGIFLFVVGCFEIKKGFSQRKVKKCPK